MENIHNIPKEFQHIGWIPCVIGSLDFSKVSTKQLNSEVSGLNAKPVCITYLNEHSIPSTKHRTRHNVVSSIYDWKDREDVENEYDGLFRFITFGKTLSNGSMEGEAFLVLHDDIRKVDKFFKSVLKPLEDLKAKVSAYHTSLRENQYSPSIKLEEEEVKSEIEQIKTAIRNIANNELQERIFNIKFLILKNGITYLKTEDWLGINNSPEYKNQIESSKYIANKQCFIYLKYSLHRHKHHNAQEDS